MVIAILFFSGNDCNSDYALVLTLSEFSSQLVASGCQWSELGITEAAPLNTYISSELPQYFPSKYKIQRLLPHETGGVSFKLIKISGGESVQGQIRIFGEKSNLVMWRSFVDKRKAIRLPVCEATIILPSISHTNDQSGFLAQSFDSGRQNNPVKDL